MSHTYTHNPVHVVFSTKERRKLIPKASQAGLWAYLAGVCKKQRIFVHEIGRMDDHIHMLIEIPLTLSFSDALQEIKTSSSQWMGRTFAWQRGFGVFGVSASNLGAVTHGDAVGYPVVAPPALGAARCLDVIVLPTEPPSAP